MNFLDSEEITCESCDGEGGFKNTCYFCGGNGCGRCQGQGESGLACEKCEGIGHIEHDIIYLNISYKKAQELKDQGVFSGFSNASLEADNIQWFENHDEDWNPDFQSGPNPGAAVVIALKYVNFEEHLALKEQSYKFSCLFDHDDILWALYINDQGEHCKFQF